MQAEVQEMVLASLSRQEQDVQVAGWVENAGKMLDAGRLAEARAEIAKITRSRPADPALAPLRRRLASLQAASDKSAEETAARRREDRLAELATRAEELFRKGQYEEALPALEEWAAAETGGTRPAGLKQQVLRALQEMRAYEAALARKQYDDALQAVSRLERINPSDPSIAELRTRAASLKEASLFTLSVFRLAGAGALMVDDQAVGTQGELQNGRFPAGRRKISIKTKDGREISSILDFSDGQTAAYVYDTSELLIRPMEEADRDRVAARKIREVVHEFQVEHRHGFLAGKCTGALLLSGLEVEYRASEKSHSFRINFIALNLTVKDDKLDFETKDKKWSADFRAPDAKKAAEIRLLWEKLSGLIR